MSAHFHPLTIAEVRPETVDSISVRFDVPPDLAPDFAFKPGQHVTLRTQVDGEEVRRNYSLCVSPLDGEVRVAIKRIAGGLFSNWANDNLAPGQTLDVLPPHGSFTCDFSPTQARHYAGFAGGSGITPILSLLTTALTVEPESRFTLFYGNRATASVMFLEQLAGLKDRFIDRLALFHLLEDEETEIELTNGRLDRAKVDEILGTVLDPAKVDAFFICGPGPMMDAVEAALLAHGARRDAIHIERFTVGPPSAAQAAAARALQAKAAGLRFTATLEGRRRKIRFDPELGNILDSVRAAGVPAPYACKAGVCATCRARVTSGEVEMAVNYGLTEEEVAAGYVLTCQAVPASDDVAVDYDA